MEVGWTGLAPTTVWGIFPRLLGLTYLIAFVSAYGQVLPIAGSRGITPVAELLDRIRVDFPFPRRLLYFPTLLWLSSGDRALRSLVLLGAGASLLVIYGGPFLGWALLVCWVAYLSLDLALDKFYPWECALLEAGFLALFLGPIESLPSLKAEPPLPVVALAFNLLLIRIMFGFGKYKFLGMTRQDFGFLKAFLALQPLPTPLGWYVQHLPGMFHRLGLLLLFLVEILLPPLALLSGPIRLVVAAGFAGLMLAIQATGNFGFFNLIVVALCIPLLDLQSPLAALSLDQAGSSWGSVVVHAVMALLFLNALLSFPFDTWTTRAWPYWPSTLQAARPLRWLVDLYRLLLPFRVVHAYGVFPPYEPPAVKFVPVIEGSLDGQTWHEFEYRWIASTERSPPRVVAPQTPRLDHFLLYEGYGLGSAGFMCPFVGGMYHPYLFTRCPPLARVMRRLAEPDSPMLALMGRDPFADGPRPRWMRATLYTLEPTSLSERRTTGRWWRRQFVGIHLPPFEVTPWEPDDWLNGPELYYWDAVVWRRRAPAIAEFERAARAATSLEELEAAAAAALGLAPGVVDRFWRELIRAVQPTAAARDWSTLPGVVEAARRCFGTPALRDFERLTAVLAIGLAARLDGRTLGDSVRCLSLPSYFHVGMLMHALILRGREAFARALADEEFVKCAARRLTPAEGLWLWGVFRFETLRGHACALSLTMRFIRYKWTPGVPGFGLAMPFVADQRIDPEYARSVVLSRSPNGWQWGAAEGGEGDPKTPHLLDSPPGHPSL